MRILVCDGDYKNSLGIVRSLGKLDHRVFSLAQKRDSLCMRSKYCYEELLVPGYEDPTFISTLLDIIDIHNIDMLIPVGTSSFKILSKHKITITERTKILIADSEAIALCMSKERTIRKANEIGIPVPRTFYPGSVAELRNIADQLTFPCVVKGRFETGHNIVEYALDHDGLIKKFDDLCNRYGLDTPENLPMVQEYIEGEGYGFFAIYDQGKCGLTFQHHRLREFPPTGGFSVAAESSRNPLVTEFGKKLLDSLNWHGVAMVEFKMNSDKVPVLMEINPKFWGSLDLALEAGVNFPAAMINIVSGKPVQFQEEYRYPFRYHWPLQGDLLYALLKPGKSIAVVWDCISPGTHSNIWIRDDLAGTIGIVRSTLTKGFRKLIKR